MDDGLYGVYYASTRQLYGGGLWTNQLLTPWPKLFSPKKQIDSVNCQPADAIRGDDDGDSKSSSPLNMFTPPLAAIYMTCEGGLHTYIPSR